MDVVVLIGRLLFVPLFLFGAVHHVSHREMMAQYTKAKKVPFPLFNVLASGVLLAVGGLSVLLGVWADLGALLLVIFLVPTAVLMHNFWTLDDPQARNVDRIQFDKDISLAGAALVMFAFFAYAGSDLGLTITGPLFALH